MTGPTRRRVLTGCGAGLVALAGCSGVPGLGGDDDGERREYDRDALKRAVGDAGEVLPPDAFPVRFPAAFQNHHREQAREYLDGVPADPSYPNEAIATKLADQRSEALAALDRDASGRPRDRLGTWRDRRTEAATVRGTHLAATGDVDREAVQSWRGQVRSRLASFEADWEHRATDPVAAAVVHETLEGYVETCRRNLDSRAAFPEDPGTAVFHAGEIVGNLDAANAIAVDAGRVREQYRHAAAETTSYRQRLAGAASRLRHSLSRTTWDLDPYVGTDVGEAFDRDLEGTPAEHLFRDASRVVEWRTDEAEQGRRDHAPATAVIETGRALVAVSALEAVVEAIRDGRYQDRPTVNDVAAGRERALGALETAWETSPRSLAVELAHPAVLSLRGVIQEVERGYADPVRALAPIVHAEAMARAVPAATEFVAAALESDGWN